MLANLRQLPRPGTNLYDSDGHSVLRGEPYSDNWVDFSWVFPFCRVECLSLTMLAKPEQPLKGLLDSSGDPVTGLEAAFCLKSMSIFRASAY